MSSLELISPGVHEKLIEYTKDSYEVIIAKTLVGNPVILFSKYNYTPKTKLTCEYICSTYSPQSSQFTIVGRSGKTIVFSPHKSDVLIYCGDDNFVLSLLRDDVIKLLKLCITHVSCYACKAPFNYNTNELKLDDCFGYDPAKIPPPCSYVCVHISKDACFHKKCMEQLVLICAICDKYICANCSITCKGCGKVYCSKDAKNKRDCCIRDCHECEQTICTGTAKFTEIDGKIFCDDCNYTCHCCLRNTSEDPDMMLYGYIDKKFIEWNFECSGCKNTFCCTCYENELNYYNKLYFCISCDQANYTKCDICTIPIHLKDVNKCSDCNNNTCDNCSKVSYGGDHLCQRCIHINTNTSPIILSKNDLKKIKKSKVSHK